MAKSKPSLDEKKAHTAKVRARNYAASLRLEGVTQVVDRPTINNFDCIKLALGMNASSIAAFIGVERAIINSTAKIDPLSVEGHKLQLLFLAAKTITDIKLHRADIIMVRPIFNGKTPIDILSEGQLFTAEQLTEMKSVDAAEFSSRIDANKGGYVQVRNAIDVVRDVSETITCEDAVPHFR